MTSLKIDVQSLKRFARRSCYNHSPLNVCPRRRTPKICAHGGAQRTDSSEAPSSSTPSWDLGRSRRLKAVESPFHDIDRNAYDLDVRHYQVPMLKVFSPPTVILSGLLFIVGANIIAEDGPSLNATAMASVPVSLWWFIFLYVLPSSFKEFAVNYMQTHDFVSATLESESEEAPESQS